MAYRPPKHVRDVVKHIKKILRRVDINAVIPDAFYGKNGYECHMIDAFEMEKVKEKLRLRFGDAVCLGHLVELKKTRSWEFWLDEFRYAEIFGKKNGLPSAKDVTEYAGEESVTIFIKTCVTKTRKQIIKLVLIDSFKLLGILNLGKTECENLLARAGQLRSAGDTVNSQHKLHLRKVIASGYAVEIDLSDYETSPSSHTVEISKPIDAKEPAKRVVQPRTNRGKGAVNWPQAVLSAIERLTASKGSPLFSPKELIEKEMDNILRDLGPSKMERKTPERTLSATLTSNLCQKQGLIKRVGVGSYEYVAQ